MNNETSNEAVPRRRVVAAGLAPLIVPRHVLGGAGYQAPSDKLTIVAVGLGGMGPGYVGACRDEEIVALCDLDHIFAAKAFQTYPSARTYKDFRQMFDKESKNFDSPRQLAVVVGFRHRHGRRFWLPHSPDVPRRARNGHAGLGRRHWLPGL